MLHFVRRRERTLRTPLTGRKRLVRSLKPKPRPFLEPPQPPVLSSPCESDMPFSTVARFFAFDFAGVFAAGDFQAFEAFRAVFFAGTRFEDFLAGRDTGALMPSKSLRASSAAGEPICSKMPSASCRYDSAPRTSPSSSAR